MGEVDENRPVATWTLDQIRQVRGLRAQAVVDVTMAEQAVIDIKAVAREKMAKSLIHMAHPFAVEPHLADFQFAESADDDRPWEIVMRCWWEPDVREVEFRGDVSDGMLLEVENAPRTPVYVPLSPNTPVWFDLDEAAIEPISPVSLTYEMTGWDETHRRWVYEVRR